MIEIIVNNQALEFDEIDLQITKNIADIREPQQRQSEWSKTITIPGTPNNNKLFNHIFDVNKSITQFQYNPNKKASCLLLVDGAVHLQGFIRLTDIVANDEQISYNITIHGQLSDLFNDIKNLKLSDLDFSEYNHTLNRDNVINSWDTSIIVNSSTTPFEYGKGYVYSQIAPKRATQNSNIRFWRVDDHIPCLYAKTIVDKIFSNVGYTYTSDSFFNSDRFKRLIIPYTNLGFQADETTQNTRLFQAQVSGATTLNAGNIIPTSNDSTGGNFDNGGNFNNSTYKYTAPASGNFMFFVALSGSISITGASSNQIADAFFGVYINGVKTSMIMCETLSVGNVFTFLTTQGVSVNVLSGDEVDIRFEYVLYKANPSLPIATYNSMQITGDTYIFNKVSANQYFYNNVVNFEAFFSGSEYTQSEILSNFVKMFNLYVEDNGSKELRFVTRDLFYNGVGLDWSEKLDYDQPQTIIPMGELQSNPYVFTFKDGKDTTNTEYKETYNRTYGDRIVRIDNDFVKSEKKIEVSFVPTPIRQLQDKIYSVIESKDSTGELRVLYFGGVQSTSAYKVYETTTTSVTPITEYPLTLHIDSVSNMQFDLNFGAPLSIDVELNLEYSNQNLVNQYYYKMISEIADKDAKLFTGYFRITKKDWLTLKFSNQYFFANNYWKLQSISNYNPDIDGLYECEFALSKYYEPSLSVVKSVGTNWADTYNGVNPSGRKTNNLSSDNRGVYIGNNLGGTGDNIVVGDLNNINGTHNTVLGSERVFIPDNFTNTTVIGSTDYTPKVEGFHVGGYLMYPNWLASGNIVSKTANYTATKEDWMIVCNTSGGNITITLPNATTNKGKMFVVKKVNSGHRVTIGTEGGLIDGSATHDQTSNHSWDQLVSDGTNYHIISEGH
jgi:hypothetical protein